MANKLGTAVVTGASSGIGAVYADRLASRGYDLQLVARRNDRLKVLANHLKSKYGVEANYVVADLGNAGDLQSFAARVREDQTINLLVNNAGVSYTAPSAQLTPEKAQAQVNLNISALMQLSLAVLPGFLARNSGTLINISSVVALFTLPMVTTYSATKAFVSLFTQGLQEEVKDTEVRIQAVLPAMTATDIWEIAGLPGGHAALDPETLMTAENCVDAALAGLDAGELITFPSLEHMETWEKFEHARLAIPAAVNTGTLATRYAIG